MLSVDSKTWVMDIESTGLIDDSTVDYTASPFKLKDSYEIHCVVFRNVANPEYVVSFVQQDIERDMRAWIDANVTKVIAHNGIGFDFLALLAKYGIEYSIGYSPADLKGTWNGKPVEIIDTLTLSKVLNPDRRRHSLEWWGEKLSDGDEKEEKIDWRSRAVELGLITKDAPKGAEFLQYHPDMLEYCIQDTKVTLKVFNHLKKQEWEPWIAKGNQWEAALELEQYVNWIATRQQHRGFFFHRDKAIENVRDLDEKLLARAEAVAPFLPEKPMSETKIKQFTPPKVQVLKNGELSSHMKKFIERMEGSVEDTEAGWKVTIENKQWLVPMTEPLKTTEAASVRDGTFIKGFLVNLGWVPTQWKERDLTCDTKKVKLSPEKFVTTVDRYVKQTLESPFCQYRLDKLKCTKETLRRKLLIHDISRPLKVLTNPTFTVGQDKEIDHNLEAMKERFPVVQEIIEYNTFAHRRNSILGGGFDPDEEDEEDDWVSGYLPNVRSDGRIPTPADTCGCNTSRFKHRVVANIPRISSLYGEEMRSLFGVGDMSKYIQFAFDFSSLISSELKTY